MRLSEQTAKQGISYFRGWLRQQQGVVSCEAVITLTDENGRRLVIMFNGVPPNDSSRATLNGHRIGDWKNIGTRIN